MTHPQSGLGALDEIRPDLRIPVVDSVPSDPVERPYGLDMPEALVPLVVLLAILAINLWVYADAKRWAARGAPVLARIDSFAVETPATWFLGCLVVFIFFFPLHSEPRGITHRSRAAGRDRDMRQTQEFWGAAKCSAGRWCYEVIGAQRCQLHDVRDWS